MLACCFYVLSIIASFVDQGGFKLVPVQNDTVPRWSHYSLRDVVFSDDGTRLASYGSDGVRVWDTAGSLVAEIGSSAHESVTHCVFIDRERIAVLLIGQAEWNESLHLYRRMSVVTVMPRVAIFNLKTQNLEYSESLPVRDYSRRYLFAVGQSLLLFEVITSEEQKRAMASVYEISDIAPGHWDKRNWMVDKDCMNPFPCGVKNGTLYLADKANLLLLDALSGEAKGTFRITRSFSDGFDWVSLGEADGGVLVTPEGLISTNADWSSRIPSNKKYLSLDRPRYYYGPEEWYSYFRNGTTVYKAESGKVSSSYKFPSTPESLSLSPDGDYCAVLFADTFWLLGSENEQPETSLHFSYADISFEEDTLRIVRGNQQELRASLVDGGRERILHRFKMSDCQKTQISRSGNHLLSIDRDHQLWIASCDDESAIMLVASGVHDAVLPDGDVLRTVSVTETAKGILRREWQSRIQGFEKTGSVEISCVDYALGLDGSVVSAVIPSDADRHLAGLNAVYGANEREPVVLRVDKIGNRSPILVPFYGLERDVLGDLAINDKADKIAIAMELGRLHLINTEGDLLGVTNQLDQRTAWIRFSRDGEHLLSSTYDTFSVYSVPELELVFTTTFVSPCAHFEVYGGRSKEFLMLGSDGSVMRFGLEGGNKIPLQLSSD